MVSCQYLHQANQAVWLVSVALSSYCHWDEWECYSQRKSNIIKQKEARKSFIFQTEPTKKPEHIKRNILNMGYTVVLSQCDLSNEEYILHCISTSTPTFPW